MTRLHIHELVSTLFAHITAQHQSEVEELLLRQGYGKSQELLDATSGGWQTIPAAGYMTLGDINLEEDDWVWRDPEGRIRRHYGFAGNSLMTAHSFDSNGTCIVGVELRDELPPEKLRDRNGVWPHARAYAETLRIE